MNVGTEGEQVILLVWKHNTEELIGETFWPQWIEFIFVEIAKLNMHLGNYFLV